MHSLSVAVIFVQEPLLLAYSRSIFTTNPYASGLERGEWTVSRGRVEKKREVLEGFLTMEWLEIASYSSYGIQAAPEICQHKPSF